MLGKRLLNGTSVPASEASKRIPPRKGVAFQTALRRLEMSRRAVYCIEQLQLRRLLAAAQVNFNDVRQTMDGFGVQPRWGENPNPPDSALQLAFSPMHGIGLDFLRGSLSRNGYNQITN